MEGYQVVELLDGFAANGLRAWVAGGWGVDVLVGRQTREHADLDLAVDSGQLDGVLNHLHALGFEMTVDWLPSRAELTGTRGRVIDVHPVTFDENGAGIQAGRDGVGFHYFAEGFTIGRIDGSPVPCLSAPQQLAFRTGYPLRPADHHDIALLRDIASAPAESER